MICYFCSLFLLVSQGIPLLPDLAQGDDEADQPPDDQGQEQAQTRDVNISLQMVNNVWF